MADPSVSIGFALLAGLLTAVSPCVLPILPILVGRSLQSHRLGPIALVLGLIASFAVVGSLLGIASSGLSFAINLLRQVAVALLLGLGLLTIFPQWGYRFFSQFPVRWLPSIPQAGLLGEFWLGTQLGLLWTPCAGPVLGSILILAAVKHQVIASWQLLMIYGIGAGLPMLGLAYASRYVSRSLKSLRAHSLLLQRVGGMTIMITAIAILLGWDVKIQLWLAPLFPTSPL